MPEGLCSPLYYKIPSMLHGGTLCTIHRTVCALFAARIVSVFGSFFYLSFPVRLDILSFLFALSLCFFFVLLSFVFFLFLHLLLRPHHSSFNMFYILFFSYIPMGFRRFASLELSSGFRVATPKERYLTVEQKRTHHVLSPDISVRVNGWLVRRSGVAHRLTCLFVYSGYPTLTPSCCGFAPFILWFYRELKMTQYLISTHILINYHDIVTPVVQTV